MQYQSKMCCMEQENTFCLLILIFYISSHDQFNDGFSPYDYSSGKIFRIIIIIIVKMMIKNSKGVNKFLSCGEGECVGGYYVIESFITIVKVSYPRQLAPCDTWLSFMKMASTIFMV